MVNPPNSNRPPNLSKGRTVSNVNIPPPDTQWSGYLLSMDLDGSQASEVAGAAPTPNPYDAETAPPAEESLSLPQPAQHLTHEEIAARVERSIQERMKEKCPPISQKHLSFSAVAWKKKMTFTKPTNHCPTGRSESYSNYTEISATHNQQSWPEDCGTQAHAKKPSDLS